MFRFFNSGLKQSVTTFPNSIYHSPNFRKKPNEEEKDNQTLSLVIPGKAQHSTYFYNKRLTENLSNLSGIAHSVDRRNLIIEFSSHIGGFRLHPLRIDALVNIAIPRWIDDKSVPAECEPRPIRSAGGRTTDDDAAKAQTDKSIKEGNVVQFNQLGHELNTKGCAAIAVGDRATSLECWSCAAVMNYPPAQFNLGVLYEARGDSATAEQWYRRAVTDGSHPTAAYNLALLLNNKSDGALRAEIKALMTLSANHGSVEALRCVECIDQLER